MREQIKLAARIYECQDSAKKLFREEYPQKIKWYTDTLKTVMEKEKLDEIKALLFISKLDSMKENGMAIMLFTAAIAELIEGP